MELVDIFTKNQIKVSPFLNGSLPQDQRQQHVEPLRPPEEQLLQLARLPLLREGPLQRNG